MTYTNDDTNNDDNTDEDYVDELLQELISALDEEVLAEEYPGIFDAYVPSEDTED
jgi:hypothetical protein